MKTIDQHTALQSLQQALLPDSVQVEGRSLRDRLNFFTHYAGLLNFYDQENTLKGDWKKFLMKDPLFLLAHISGIDVSGRQKLFDQSMVHLGKWVKKEKAQKTEIIKPIPKKVGELITSIMDQLTEEYLRIYNWVSYMKQFHHHYQLREYLMKEMEEQYGFLFEALLDFRKFLFEHGLVPGLKRLEYGIFDQLDPEVWKKNDKSIPFWELLPLGISEEDKNPEKTLLEISLSTIAEAIQYSGEKLFDFLSILTSEAKNEFEQLETKHAHYPDTLLLRTFSELLEVSQKEMNKLTARHQKFYYKSILKQKKRMAKADKVFSSMKLAANTSQYTLAEGTLFNAGKDAKQQPIQFETTKENVLNAAAIQKAYTLFVDGTAGATQQLYLKEIPKPAAILKNQKGQVQHWATFGGDTTGLQPQKMGIAFASPMFYLKEGERTLKLSFTLNKINDSDSIFEHTSFYFSTAAGWQSVKYTGDPVLSGNSTVELTFNLPAAYPSVVPFKKKTDGYISAWPILKLEFDQFVDVAAPLVVQKLTIQVNVKGMSQLELYNDSGKLNVKKPFQPFGVHPAIDSNFFIGSNEIFSKPVYQLNLAMNWTSLPKGGHFSTYYKEYNDYLLNYILKEAKELTEEVEKEVKEKKASIKKLYLQRSILTDLHEKAIAAANQQDAKPGRGKRNRNPFKWLANLIEELFHRMVSWFKEEAKRIIDEVDREIEEIAKRIETELCHIGKEIDKDIKAIEKAVKDAIDKIDKEIQKLEEELEDLVKNRSYIDYFNNLSFRLNFNALVSGEWSPCFGFEKTTGPLNTQPVSYKSYQPSEVCGFLKWLDDDSNPLYLYSTDKDCKLTDQSDFTAGKGNNLVFTAYPDLQLKPLALNDQTQHGFVSMQLSEPEYGFGMSLYPKVLSWIAMQNASDIIINRNKGDEGKAKAGLLATPNAPYSPTLKNFTANYEASITYDLTTNGTYPLECYSYTPFSTFKTYDSTAYTQDELNRFAAYSLSGYTVKNEKISASVGLPLHLPFKGKGSLFLQMDQLEGNEQLNLYFQLAPIVGSLQKSKIHYHALAQNQWLPATLLADGTRQYRCSGITSIQLPTTLSTQSVTMPQLSGWVSITVTDEPQTFGNTIYLNTNGVELVRSGTSYLEDTTNPQIAANTISTPASAIPEIASVSQPFPSFGGRAAENHSQFYQRVSNRIATKGRAVNPANYYRLIGQKFPQVYYSTVEYDTNQKQTNVYLLRGIENPNEAHAFYPVITECMELEVKDYLKKKVSAFAKVNPGNFTYYFQSVQADIGLKSGVAEGFLDQIAEGLNLFLSPWIKTEQKQAEIQQKVSSVEVANYIHSFPQVKTVEQVKVLIYNNQAAKIGTINSPTDPLTIIPSTEDLGAMYGSYLQHTLNPIQATS